MRDMDVSSSTLQWIVLGTAWVVLAARSSVQRPDRPPFRPTRWGAALWGVVAAGSFAQMAWPALLGAGMRDRTKILDGQVWRLLTSMVLQDGGWAGLAFNLATLAVTVLLVPVALSGRAAVTVFVLGGVVSNLLALAEPGAGNSMATTVLAVTATVVVLARWGPAWAWVATGVQVVAGVMLIVAGDQHGAPVFVGVTFGAALATLPDVIRNGGSGPRNV